MSRPGLTAARMESLVRSAVERCRLDLLDAVVLTEAATGPYVVTPVIAALAGAEVVAVAGNSRYGTVDDVAAETLALARCVGVADQIEITADRTSELFARADVITNSGHVRPIIGEVAAAIRPGSVLSLMFEAWEVQAGRVDIDLAALAARGVRIAGTNERHPDVDVFSFLGPMAVAQLSDAGISAYRGRIAVLCDNPFAEFLTRGLKNAGADVQCAESLNEFTDRPDALIVAMRPTGSAVVRATEIAARWPGIPVMQFWGDIDRSALDRAGIPYWPAESPGPGHMGVLPSRVGPEPIVRLQVGGLKVAQVLLTADPTIDDLEYLDPIKEIP